MSRDVLIVGAGIAGLGLARGLSQRGVPCSVMERAPAVASSGLGLFLPGNALNALAELGLGEAVAARGMPIDRREYRNGSGRLLFSVDERAFWGSPSRCLRRSDLMSILGTVTAGVSIRTGTEVTAVEHTPDGARVVLASGSVETHDLVVGADGVRSTVRASVAAQAAPRPAVMSGASWRFITANHGVDCWTVWSGPPGTILLVPVAEGLAYGYASSTRGVATGRDPAWLARAFRTFPEPVPATVDDVLRDPTDLYPSPVEEIRMDRWSRGRVLVIGDAGHATAPIWAQGAAMALEDALVLAELLVQTDDWAGVGTTFERRRRERITHVQKATDRMARIARLPGWLRDRTAPRIGARTYRDTFEPLRAPAHGGRPSSWGAR